ncbi:hypothetical protein D5274_09785 [bacterium 1XD42-94]|nr:hypothetical protein [bacterium 1XD42-94]
MEIFYRKGQTELPFPASIGALDRTLLANPVFLESMLWRTDFAFHTVRQRIACPGLCFRVIVLGQNRRN